MFLISYKECIDEELSDIHKMIVVAAKITMPLRKKERCFIELICDELGRNNNYKNMLRRKYYKT